MRTLYHATPERNAGSILTTGLHPSADGYVYLAESIADAKKFLFYEPSNVWIFAVKFNNQDAAQIEETFDHSIKFFDCRVFGYRGVVPPGRISATMVWKKS